MDDTTIDRRQLLLQLKKVDRDVTQLFEKRMDISFTRYEILLTLRTLGSIPQKALQQALAIDQAAITRHLKILEQQLYIVRKRNEENNREVLVSLSETGAAALDNCSLSKQQFLSTLFDAFSTEDLQVLQQFLQRLAHNSEQL